RRRARNEGRADRQRQGHNRGRRGPTPARAPAARRGGPHRDPHRLRDPVLRDGESLKSCTVLAAQADGHSVTTLEGLASDAGEMHPVQRAFHTEHGLQCGYCTPGMVMAIVSLLKENPAPTEADVRQGLEGNICRCTGYHNIVRAALAASGAATSAEGASQ